MLASRVRVASGLEMTTNVHGRRWNAAPTRDCASVDAPAAKQQLFHSPGRACDPHTMEDWCGLRFEPCGSCAARIAFERAVVV